MKIRKKFIIYTIFVLFFVIYLFSANYLFNILIKIDNEASLANITLPSETQDVKFRIEALRSWKLKWKDALLMQGWVFKINVKKGKRDVYLVLKSKNCTLIFGLEKDNLIRNDVRDFYHMAGDINNHGFEIIIPLYRLKEDAYQIGFVIEDETGKYYYNSNKALKVSDEHVFLGDYEPEIISHQVSLCLIDEFSQNCR